MSISAPFRHLATLASKRAVLAFFSALVLIVFVAGGQLISEQSLPVRIMPLGDSITQGVNDTPPSGGYVGYRGPLWSQLGTGGFNIDMVGSLADGPTTIDRDHEGHGGFRIDQILAGIDSYLAAASPDLILLHIGTNDLLQGLSVDTATQRLAELLDRIHQDRPSAHVIVASIIPVRNPNAFGVDPQLFADFVSHTAALVGDRAAQGWRISHVDMATLAPLSSSEYDSVGIHPTDAGYAKMAAVWRAEVATIIDGDAPPTLGVTYPFDLATISGQVTLSANAFDDFGVADVAFVVDGVSIGDDVSAPYQAPWNSAAVADGPHTLVVTARDTAGQTRSQTVHFKTANQLADPALVAAFGFEESGALALDSSGRGNNASLVSVTRTAQGHTGGAIQLDGNTGHIEIPFPGADLRFTSAFTISAWVNPTTLGSGWHTIAARQVGAIGNDSWWLGHNGTTLFFGSVTTTLAAGQWTHIAAVKNGATEQLYKNGTLVASTSSGSSTLTTDANEVGIGAGNNGNPAWGEVFNGRLDDVRFYVGPRTAAQIQADAATAVGGGADVTPPSINGVAAAPTDVGATITWTTDEPSTSQVDVGPTTNYGTTTPLDTNLVTSHSVSLSGLSAASTYHYRVRSRDASMNVATSGDASFTTAGGPATLVAAYGFEETSGPTAVDTAGGDNPGTLVNGVTRTAAGRYGRGLSFDGFDDGVTVANAAALNPGTGAFTVGVWVKTTSATFQRVIGKRVNCSTNAAFWNLQLFASGVVAAEAGDSTTGTYVGIVGTHAVNDGAWHYLTLVRNGVAALVYVDGALEASGSATTVANISNTAGIQIGNLCGDGLVNGQLDEVRYYNGALSPSQIQAAMASGVAATSTLMAAYSFDAGSGPTAADQSGRGNTLALTSTTWAAQGHTNGSLEFNGSSSRAELPSPATDLGFTTTFTISTWVYPLSLGSGWHAIVSRQLGSGTNDSWWLGHNGTTLYFGSVNTSLVAGQWTHIAAVKNGSTEQLYKNGALVASTSAGVSALSTDANEVGIGAGNNGNPSWGENFNGRLDDLRFYSEARTATQIQSDASTPVGGGGGGGDITPPAIGSVSASPSQTGATITWTTDEAATSQVDVGPDTNYGTTTPLDSNLVTSHSVTLSGLSAGTPYHYRVRSQDASQNVATSGDNSFTTTGAAGPTLVAAYGFEETTGTTAVDSAGGDNPGTLVGGVMRTASGRYGRGLSFDGIDDGVTVANAAALNPGTGAFSVGVWVNSGSATFQRVIGKRVSCSTSAAFWNLQLFSSGVVAGEVGDSTAGTYVGIVGTHVVNDGGWHYLTLVRNDVSVQLFVDGMLDVSGTATAAANISNTASVQVGNLCGDGPFSGQLDEVRYYDGPLTAGQIQTAMAGGVAGTSTLVAAYNFDAGSGPTAADLSGRGNTLALTSTTWAPQGHTNSALEFNGTSSRAELPTPATDLGFTTTFTISTWLYPIALGSGWHSIVSRQVGTGTNDSWWLGHNGSTLYFGSVNTTLTAGQWTHIAVVKNGSSEQLYKNGTLVSSTNAGASSLSTDANEVGIGAGNNGNPLWAENFNGRLDDLRFYAEARSAAQIQADSATPVQ